MKEHFHFIGIGGIGMSALARILLAKGCTISGSDTGSSPILTELKEEGATIYSSHAGSNLPKAGRICVSSGVKDDNPELKAAIEQKLSVIKRGALLAELMGEAKTAIGVVGTHGKTTTTALLIDVLRTAGLNPTYAVGGVLGSTQKNAELGSDELFVAELDESDGSFLEASCDAAILTSLDDDHLDHYGSFDALSEAFKEFSESVEDLFFFADDSKLAKLDLSGTPYGTSPKAELRLLNYHQSHWFSTFDVWVEKQEFKGIELALSGSHNALNALAVFGLAKKLGADPESICEAFKNFRGIARRQERKVERANFCLVDDYAHHPKAVAKTLRGIRGAVGARRLIVAFQPHRYSRTEQCYKEFASAFEEADEVFLTDIYPAGEKPIKGVTSQLIASGMNQPVTLVKRSGLAKALSKMVRPFDVVVSMGAGDITRLADELEHTLLPPYKLGVVRGESPVSVEGLPDCDVVEVNTPLKPGKDLTQLLNCEILAPLGLSETGAIQGFFETFDKPYIGCDHKALALCQNKALCKDLMFSHGVDTPAYVKVDHSEWIQGRQEVYSKIAHRLRLPVFVKPFQLNKAQPIRVDDESQLLDAIESAFSHDTAVLVENGIEGQEVSFLVVGGESVSVLPNTGPGARLAEVCYKTAGCDGFAEVHFIQDEQGEFWFTEIHPFPSLNENSSAQKILADAKMSVEELFRELIILGLSRQRRSR